MYPNNSRLCIYDHPLLQFLSCITNLKHECMFKATETQKAGRTEVVEKASVSVQKSTEPMNFSCV